MEVASFLDLMVNFPKSKFMVIGSAMSEDDQQPLAVDDGLIECVDHFLYLGSMIANENNLDAEIVIRIMKASKALEHYETVFL